VLRLERRGDLERRMRHEPHRLEIVDILADPLAKRDTAAKRLWIGLGVRSLFEATTYQLMVIALNVKLSAPVASSRGAQDAPCPR
jgi:hypothetical protein